MVSDLLKAWDERRSYADGQYIVQLGPDRAPEVTRYAGDFFFLPGSSDGLEPRDLYRIGPRIEIDPATLAIVRVAGED